jgi:YcaO-like protein with predicted kinase domain
MLTNHKEKSPTETIRFARALLAELGVPTFERAWYEVEGETFSVRLEADGAWKGCAVNGKGASRELALASAYGEILERIQNGAFSEPSFWVMPERFAPPDAKELTVAEVCRRWPQSAGRLFTEEAAKLLGSQRHACVPFYDAHDGEVAYLPLRFLRLTHSSTGMTAGNSAAEALVQGLCEVNERQAINEVSRARAVLPTIPLERVPDGYSRRLIERLRADGWVVHVKDATFGGRYPVLATLLVAPERAAYHIHFGSDPVFEIALQRSLTELCQGYSDLAQRLQPFPWATTSPGYSKPFADWAVDVRDPADVRDLQRLAYTKDGAGGLGEGVLLDRPYDPACLRAFVPERATNEEMLGHLVRLCEAAGGRVLARDVSFLGFPAYQVHVPRWAEDCTVDRALAEVELELPAILRTASALGRASVRDLGRFADTIERWRKLPAMVQGPISRICPMGATEDGELSNVLADPDVLLFLANLRRKDWARANTHVARLVERRGAEGEDEDVTYFRAVAAYVHLRAAGTPTKTALGSVSALFGDALAAEIADDVDPAKDPFRHQRLMTCGDCRGCTCRGICGYEEWKARWAALLPRMTAAAIDQARLGDVFRAAIGDASPKARPTKRAAKASPAKRRAR